MSKYVDKCLVLEFLAQVLTTMKGKRTNEKKKKTKNKKKQKVHCNILDINIHLKGSEINNLIMITVI